MMITFLEECFLLAATVATSVCVKVINVGIKQDLCKFDP